MVNYATISECVNTLKLFFRGKNMTNKLFNKVALLLLISIAPNVTCYSPQQDYFKQYSLSEQSVKLLEITKSVMDSYRNIPTNIGCITNQQKINTSKINRQYTDISCEYFKLITKNSKLSGNKLKSETKKKIQEYSKGKDNCSRENSAIAIPGDFKRFCDDVINDPNTIASGMNLEKFLLKHSINKSKTSVICTKIDDATKEYLASHLVEHQHVVGVGGNDIGQSKFNAKRFHSQRIEIIKLLVDCAYACDQSLQTNKNVQQLIENLLSKKNTDAVINELFNMIENYQDAKFAYNKLSELWEFGAYCEAELIVDDLLNSKVKSVARDNDDALKITVIYKTNDGNTEDVDVFVRQLRNENKIYIASAYIKDSEYQTFDAEELIKILITPFFVVNTYKKKMKFQIRKCKMK